MGKCTYKMGLGSIIINDDLIGLQELNIFQCHVANTDRRKQ